MRKQVKWLCIPALSVAAPAIAGQKTPEKQTPEQQSRATEVWSPQPKPVDTTGNIPGDALPLVAADAWENAAGGPAKWTFDAGEIVVSPGTGDIRTRESFCDVQLHVEWQVPSPIENGKELTSQDRNNSGIFLQELYEVQVLDSYRAATYVNGQAGSIYKQSIPLVNASRPPEQWQSYDIIYTAPKFGSKGRLLAPARITVLQNGVLVQKDFAIQGPTAWIGHPKYKAHGCAPLRLQDHGHPVRFRNIWIRRL